MLFLAMDPHMVRQGQLCLVEGAVGGEERRVTLRTRKETCWVPCFPQTITNKSIEWEKIPWEPQNYFAIFFSLGQDSSNL